MSNSGGEEIIILGAGPAGLACAYELSKNNLRSTVIDRNPAAGGLLRNVSLDGCILDVGGHRFLSKSEEVNSLWNEILGGELIRVKRKSRIFYRGHYFDYPLNVWNALKGLGIWETLRCLLSYLKSKWFPVRDTAHFEGWMINRFGKRLYEIFFKTYTEKVWGVPCSVLSSDWADQRIQELSLGKAVREAVRFKGKNKIKTLSENFLYPALGPGFFCETLKSMTENAGCLYRLQTEVFEIFHQNNRITEVLVQNCRGPVESVKGSVFFSSLPLPLLIEKLRPHVPSSVLKAARSLTFRSFIAVYLILDIPDLFPDQWLYIHDPSVKAGRIQNYKNWSAAMVPDPQKTSLGMEYFVTEGDGMWNLPDSELIELALSELEKLKFLVREKFIKGSVVRVPNAYPLYSPGYRKNVEILKEYAAGFTNLQTLGRAGLFRYNNSDHALLTGLYGARNIMGKNYDLWAVDPDAE